MEVVAVSKNVRISPQKVRLVTDQIKKMKPQQAVEMLDFVAQKASIPLKKVLASALANAKNNFGQQVESLAIKSIQVQEGRKMKRYRPVSRGRAHEILRRTSNITVVLEAENKTNTADKSNKSNKKGNETEVKNGPKS